MSKLNAIILLILLSITIANSIAIKNIHDEVFAQEVTLTKNGYYRSWIGLRLPMGEYNKMYNYSIETVVDAFKLKEMADKAYDEVEVIANES